MIGYAPLCAIQPYPCSTTMCRYLIFISIWKRLPQCSDLAWYFMALSVFLFSIHALENSPLSISLSLYFSLFFGVCSLSSSLPPFSHSLYSSTPSLPLFQGIETTNLTLLNKLRLLTCNMHSLNHNVVTRWYISSAIAFLYIYITSYQMYQLIYV